MSMTRAELLQRYRDICENFDASRVRDTFEAMRRFRAGESEQGLRPARILIALSAYDTSPEIYMDRHYPGWRAIIEDKNERRSR